MIIQYKDAKKLICEADVLLFRPQTWIGRLICIYSQSPYSHVGLAHWYNNELYCLEMREFKGARSVQVDNYIKSDTKIDVFRVCNCICQPQIKKGYDDYYFQRQYHPFTDDIAKKITDHALNLVLKNTDYGYILILKMLRTYLPFIRFWHRPKYQDNNGDLYVCSTLITKTYRKYYKDPVEFLADEYTKPGDIARSSIFTYLFTIGA